jgi:hypothetical protein
LKGLLEEQNWSKISKFNKKAKVEGLLETLLLELKEEEERYVKSPLQTANFI